MKNAIFWRKHHNMDPCFCSHHSNCISDFDFEVPVMQGNRTKCYDYLHVSLMWQGHAF
jgi:hypothetical protein